MKAREYHKWWKSSQIGLGYPLEAENYLEMSKKLSPAGVAVAIVIHLIPDVAACEKDYLISDLEADYGTRWEAALREMGADRLAEFVKSSIGVDHISRISESVSMEEFTAALQSGKSMIDVQQIAAERYFESFDFETKTELEALADQFAEAHDVQLRSDIARHGNRVGEMDDGHNFEANWSDAVDEKHERQDQDRRRAKLDANLSEWQECLEQAAQSLPTGIANSGLITSLANAHRELQSISPEQLGSDLAKIRSEIAELIAENRDLFPKDVRPDRDALQAAECTQRLQEFFSTADVEWLQAIGDLESVSVSSSVLGRADAFDVDIEFARLHGINWGWITPGMAFRLEDLSKPLAIPENVRAAVEAISQRDYTDLSKRLAAALLADFRSRFLPELSSGPLHVYKPNVTDSEILADVDGLAITVIRESHDPMQVRVVFLFGVEWDPEHGICFAESSDGRFELSEP